ncbi:hypothetical protein PENTCL1PPCAC_20618, partial [Pristionchus entomophagus]
SDSCHPCLFHSLYWPGPGPIFLLLLRILHSTRFDRLLSIVLNLSLRRARLLYHRRSQTRRHTLLPCIRLLLLQLPFLHASLRRSFVRCCQLI